MIVYSTDSDEHKVNIGEKRDPLDDLIRMYSDEEYKEDINAISDYLDDVLWND